MKDGKFDSTKIREASDIIGSGLKLANAINISQALEAIVTGKQIGRAHV